MSYFLGFLLGYNNLNKILEPLNKYYWKKRLKNFGVNTTIMRSCEIIEPQEVCVGDNVYIGKRVSIYGKGGLIIGNDVLIANDCTILTRNHDFDANRNINIQGFTYKKVVLNDDVWLGNKVIILPGVTIGKGAVVAAGAVVTKDVLPNSIVGGVPAKLIAYRK